MEHWLGIPEFGKYKLAPGNRPYAFTKLADIEAQLEAEDANEPAAPIAIDPIAEQEPAEEPQNPDNGQVDIEHDDIDQIPAPRPNIIDAQGRPTQIHTTNDLWTHICESEDKLFFIRHQHTGDNLERWDLVQVDMDETDPQQARHQGIYHVRWYIQEYRDSKKYPIKQCRFWPNIHDMIGEEMGKLVTISPKRAQRYLQTHNASWYQMSIPLFRQRLVGPFNFHTDTQTRPKRYNMIAVPQWDQLAQILQTLDIHDTTNNTVPITLVTPP